MPASVFEGSYKFLYNHFIKNLGDAALLGQQGLLPEELLKKCQNSYKSIEYFENNAQQFGIKLQ